MLRARETQRNHTAAGCVRLNVGALSTSSYEEKEQTLGPASTVCPTALAGPWIGSGTARI